jgi:hypothetical protein
VKIQRTGELSISLTDCTIPVTDEPLTINVVSIQRNCANRQRRANFGSVVSNDVCMLPLIMVVVRETGIRETSSNILATRCHRSRQTQAAALPLLKRDEGL